MTKQTTCFLLLSVLISLVSQILLKREATTEHRSIIEEYCNIGVISAYCMFLRSTLLSIAAYKGIPLSLGPVLESTSYICNCFWDYDFQGEN